MSGQFWKYCGTQQEKEFILSLNLLPAGMRERMSGEAQLSLLYALSNHTERHYRRARIPKKSGGSRRLLVPDGLLKSVQRNILRHCLDGRSVSAHTCAYRRGLSPIDNAAPHAGGEKDKILLKLDIRDFFDSILFPRVYVAAFPESLFPPAAAGLLTHLCCCYDRLPQGAPTSPAISNLVMKPFDDFMGKWCEERQIAYTRYCDDLAFSGSFDGKEVFRRAEGFLRVMGFEVNRKKTVMARQGMRQSVTGLVVNDRVRTDAAYRRRIRQEMYYCTKFGVREHLRAAGKLDGTEAERKSETEAERKAEGKAEAERAGKAETEAEREAETAAEEYAFLQSLRGRIGYVLQMEPENREFLGYREACGEMLRAAAAWQMRGGEDERTGEEKHDESGSGLLDPGDRAFVLPGGRHDSDLG